MNQKDTLIYTQLLTLPEKGREMIFGSVQSKHNRGFSAQIREATSL